MRNIKNAIDIDKIDNKNINIFRLFNLYNGPHVERITLSIDLLKIRNGENKNVSFLRYIAD